MYNTQNNMWNAVRWEPVSGGPTGTRWPRYSIAVDGDDADPFPFSHSDVESYNVTCTSGRTTAWVPARQK